ncbi:MAG: tetratricopeptide repeat protein [Spartobacteria bacterium]|nr:tetratricopeptide repeat protein [Spartobacteria bacterium]
MADFAWCVFMMNTKRYTYAVLLLILALAIGYRVAYYRQLARDPLAFLPIQDAEYHDYWARGIVFDQWTPPASYADPCIADVPYFRPPGYVWALGLLYRTISPTVSAAVIAQMILGIINILLCLYLTKVLMGIRAALFGALLMSMYWVFMFFEGTLLDVTLHITLLLLCFIVMAGLTRRGLSHVRVFLYSLLSGLLLGAATIIRPNFLLFIPVAAIWLFVVLIKRDTRWRRGLMACALFVIGAALVISPVTIRNYSTGGGVVLISSNAGLMFFMGNSEDAVGVTGTGDLNKLQNSKYRSCFDYPTFVEALSKAGGQPLSHAEASSYLIKQTLRRMVDHPYAFLGNTLRKAGMFWRNQELGHNHEMPYTRRFYPALRALKCNFACIFALFCVGAGFFYLALRQRRTTVASDTKEAPTLNYAMAILLLLFIGTVFLSVLPFVFSSQYRMSVIPFMLPFAGYALDRLAHLVKTRSYEQVGIGLTIIVALIYLSAGTQAGSPPSSAQWHYQRAALYERLERIDEAIAEYQLAIDAQPDHAWAHGALGALLAQHGQSEEGAAHLERALLLEPDYPRAQVSLAYLYHLQRKTQAGIDLLQQVLAKNPDHIQALNTLAWIWGTTFSPDFTNAEHAIELAQHLNELTRYSNPSYLDTLAAAYATGSRFDEAVETARRAEELARRQQQDGLARLIRARMKIYEAHKRYITNL